MGQFKPTRRTNIFRKTPLIALAALPLTVGAVLAQQSGATADTTAQAQQAQSQRVQPTQSAQRGTPSPQAPPRTQSGPNHGDVFLQKLAAQLGVSVEKLKAAALAASNATIDQGVKDGDIASNRAAEMKTRLKDHPFGMLGGRGLGAPDGRGGRGLHGPGRRGGEHDGGPRGGQDAPDQTTEQTDGGAVDPNAQEGGS